MRQDSDDRKTGRPRRKTRMSLKIPVLIIVLVLAVVTTIALMLPVFNVVEVYCEGNSEVKTEDIITAAKLETGKNIFLENLGRARRSVESITNIKSVEIRRVFPNKICISVSERVPFAYVPSNGGVALVSEEGIVLKVSDGGEAAMISDAKTPKFDTAQTDGEKSDSSKTNDKKSDSENKNSDTTDDSDNKNDDSSDNNDSNSDNKSNDSQNSDKSDSKNSDKSDSKNSDSGQNNSGLDSAAGQTENSDVLAVPLVSGFELNNVKEGKKAESGDSDKFNKMYELCRALKGAELLNRTTYINVENLDDITVVIENRLEVQLAKAENINYRCRFLAEVINTKLSATESVILDYRGDDIYAINRDDGGERVKKTKTNKSTDNSDGTTDKKNGAADTDGSDNSDDSTGSNDTSSSSSSSSSSNSSSSSSSSNSDSSPSKKNSGSSRTNSTSSDEQDEYL